METSHHEGAEAHGQGQALPEGWWGADVFWQLFARRRGDPDIVPSGSRRENRTLPRLLAGPCLGGDTLYGINTGFGDLATTRVDDLVGLQRNLLISHACGVGEPLPNEVVRPCFC